jgi:hypothetical protein
VRRASGSGNARIRWGANAESLAVVGYVGPARVLDASLRGTSLFLVIRRYGTGVSGTLTGEEGVSGKLLRFIATPWDFSPAWARSAVLHAALRESGQGWSLDGAFGTDDSRFSLGLSQRGEPQSLALRRAGASNALIRVRYGPERNYQAGRIPSWIEWSFSGSVVTLTIEDHAPADASKIRYVSKPEADWMIFDIDESGGRSLVRWLLGLSEEKAEP